MNKAPKTVIVVDGMGGGIGAQLAARIRREIKAEISLLALGTNALASQRMVEAGALRGASGENAFRVTLASADFILGPVGIVLANSMMGELSPLMAEAVLASPARRILLPISQSHVTIVGLAQRSVNELIDEALAALAKGLDGTE
jgi:hypothetical protein